MGTFTGLRFAKINQMGRGIFEAKFSEGTLVIAVEPLSPVEKIAGRNRRPQ
jgi:hypothetical protein